MRVAELALLIFLAEADENRRVIRPPLRRTGFPADFPIAGGPAGADGDELRLLVPSLFAARFKLLIPSERRAVCLSAT